MIARHFSVWYKDDINPPAAQWVSDPLPATKVAGYIMLPFDTILGKNKQEVYRESLRVTEAEI